MTTKKYIITADDVEDNLTSTLQDVPLSANQGRVLNTSKVDKNQGTAQAGKVLGIGADGLVYAMNAGTAAHASSHASGGSDAVSLAASQITSGTLSADRLPKASTSAFGAVKVGDGLSVSGGVVSVSGGSSPKLNVSNTNTEWACTEYYKLFVPVGSKQSISRSGYTGNGSTYVFPAPLYGTIDIPMFVSGYEWMKLYVKQYFANGTTSEAEYTNHTGSYVEAVFTSVSFTGCVVLVMSVLGYHSSVGTKWYGTNFRESALLYVSP